LLLKVHHMTSDLLEERDLALQLHGVLSDIDPVRWRDEMAQKLKPTLRELQARFAQKERTARLAVALQSELPARDTKRQWLQFKKRLQPAYMELAERLQAASIHVPSLRPTNYARNVFHVTSATVALLLIELVPEPSWLLGIAVAWAAFAWSCELARRTSPRVNELLMKVFSKVAHPHETKRVNSATWYATALVLLAATQSTALCVAGVVVLGVGDPMAALVGRRFGRTKLMHGRSLEGTLAFALSAAAATFIVLALFHPAMGLGFALAAGATAAVFGAVAELVSLRVDDNFSIPLSAAAGVWLLGALLGAAI
jgi:dolichol kinase